MTAYHAARIRLANRRRLEVVTFINDETCGYEIFDRISGRVVERGTGYDGNYASRRAGDDALLAIESPECWARQYGFIRDDL